MKTTRMPSTAREVDTTQEGFDIREMRSWQDAAACTRVETVTHAFVFNEDQNAVEMKGNMRLCRNIQRSVIEAMSDVTQLVPTLHGRHVKARRRIRRPRHALTGKNRPTSHNHKLPCVWRSQCAFFVLHFLSAWSARILCSIRCGPARTTQGLTPVLSGKWPVLSEHGWLLALTAETNGCL